jgi:DNA gyrase subunit A
MEVGLVRRIDIDDEMQQSYLDYAMSVIVSRALPDARDGLKPVHRRILYAMQSMGIRPDSDFKKSARIVGEVLGKYHPHGDMAVYDAMARMAQSFSMRYPLVEGQGNFGSIDGDPPAAMRYTEARMDPLSTAMMADLAKGTVDSVDNFDGSLQEPNVLPAAAPNLLVNGATGIAVGMSTSIPPHNMGEVCDALIHMLGNWTRLDTITLDDLMKFIPGPDFPTGGIILCAEEEGKDLSAAYGSGRGKITVQARAHIEEMSRGRSRIIVTELPYQTNKSSLIERIADLARAGTLEGLSDLRDESDRQGMRIVLELAKTADPEKLLADLYRRTPMQTTFSVIMLALVDGEPRLLNLKQALRVYLDHRLTVVRRRSEFDLARAKEREHILAGLKIALQNLDDVIQMIRTSKDAQQASQRLQKRLKLTEIQATAILDMPLRRLSSLERKKVDVELKDVQALIKKLGSLLRSKKKMRTLIAEELAEIKNQYSDRRRTLIVEKKKGMRAMDVLTASDLASTKETWVVLTAAGTIYRTPTARLPRLSGRNAPKLVVGASGRDILYLFDRHGNAVCIAAHTIPECDDPKDASPLASITPFSHGAEPVTALALPPDKLGRKDVNAFILFGTVKGMVKKTNLESLPGPSAKPFLAVKVSEGDALGWVQLTQGADDICMITNQGMAIRFSEADVRPMGFAAAGVYGIRLDEEGSRVVGMGLATRHKEVLLISSTGWAKRTALNKFPKQGRYGKGVLAWKSGEDISLAGGAFGDAEDRAIAHLTKGASRSIRFSDAPRRVRASAGKQLFEIPAGVEVSGLSSVIGRPTFETMQPPVERPGKSTKKKQKKKTAKEQSKKGTTKRKTKKKTTKKS